MVHGVGENAAEFPHSDEIGMEISGWVQNYMLWYP